MVRSHRLPTRDKVKPQDTWDLSSLYRSDADWEKGFKQLSKMPAGFGPFRGQLGQGAQRLAECLEFDLKVDQLAERVGTYAFLKTTEDQANSHYQGMVGRYQHLATRLGEASSYIRPEILAIPTKTMDKMLTSRELRPHLLSLQRLLRRKPHTLTDREEQILAMQGEMSQAAGKIFRQLLDADLKFGTVEDEHGQQVELTNATFSQLLISPKRSVRKAAFHQYYDQLTAHENSLAAALTSSVHRDIYYARVRNHESALDAALFPDNVPKTVYTSLIKAVRNRLPVLHRYYDLRRRKMKIKEIHHYDTYVPILSGLESTRTWDAAAKTIITALAPLGNDYCQTLEAGLTGRWSDRYPNVGKQSGAFSCGTFDGDPYILMNYKPQVLDDMFTLAHEAGHSMHSYYSAKSQPYSYYNYTIFVAEVASTFNEQLLSHHLMQQAGSDKERAYLINRDIDAIRGTIIRQTMFAEFEKKIHEMGEAGEPLTLQTLTDTYGHLLAAYFGPDFTIDSQLKLECLRIPHFYRAFYVYKYATGLSAAIALSRRVLQGGEGEVADYMGFLQGGCSQDPLDLLRGAGVDMEKPKPVTTALDHFENLVTELEQLL